jgi:membrane protein DedA with SNARE-associated domain
MFDAAVHWLTETIFALGYPGIVLLMAIESSFFPLPSELVMPPAGYLAAQGRMDVTLAVVAGALGSLLGALFNYYFAVYLGEPFLRRYGRYFFVSNESLDRTEAFFRRHGEIGTFVGRFVPVVRHLISIPAGLSRMRLGRFAFFTTVGAGIWCAVLAYIGWLLGRHEGALREAAVNTHTRRALLYILPALVIILTVYTWWYRRRRGRGGPVA